MDQIKIGKFISEMRKEQNMTQKQLAELLNISDKTVSKWECGKGMPDNSILLELCDVLHINVNELLSGEKVSSDNYHRKAEENMLQLIDKSEKEHRNYKWNILGLLLECIIVGLLVFISSGGISGFYAFIDAISLLVILAISLLVLTLSGSMKDFFYSFILYFSNHSTASKEKIQHCLLAVKLMFITILLAGGFSTMVEIIAILASRVSTEILGVNIAVASLSLLYSLILDIFLLPVWKKLHTMLIG